MDQIRIGHYFDVSDRDGCNPSDTSVVYTDNVYIDTTWARVELGNASTYAASTHREIQIPSAWSANSITATVNPGSFTSGQAVYLFVIDANGNASNGYPVTIGSGGTTPTCSNCCSTTQTCPTAMTTVGTCTRCCATACQTASTDTTAPRVTAFTITPTTLTVGASLTANYTVTDNTALARAELWRAPSGTNCTDTVKTGCVWTQVTSANITGTSRTGTFTSSPTAAGTFYYGLHAVDAANNIGYESAAVRVTVNAATATCTNCCSSTQTCPTAFTTVGTCTRCCATTCQTAASGGVSISSVSGTVNNGSNITISGSGFGAMNGNIISWDNFEAHSTGVDLSTRSLKPIIGPNWSTFKIAPGTDPVVINSERAHSGAKSVLVDWGTGTINSFGWAGQGPFDHLYISYWRYQTGDFAASTCNHKQFYLYGNNNQFPQNMPLIPAGGTSWGYYNNAGDSSVPYSERNNMNTLGWSYSNTSNKFQRWEFYTQLNTPYTQSNGIIKGWLDGRLGIDNDNYRHRYVDGEFVDFRLGHMAQGFTSTARAWFDDLYISTTQARAELCNTSSWGSRTHCEIQAPSAWSANSVTVAVNPGSFTSGQTAYLYVIDANGNASNGYSVTIGSGGTTPTCSNCCSTTQTCPTAFTTVGSCTRCCATACQTASTDTTAPRVTAFTITPTTLTMGASLTANYTVTDNTALSRAELWRAPSGTNCTDTVKTGCVWTQVTSANITGTSRTGTFTSAPTAAGTFYYGLHAVDAANNVGYEPAPVRVTVNAQTQTCTNCCSTTQTCPTAFTTVGTCTRCCATACQTAPSCGNGNCETGETCSSCASDCGACPSGQCQKLSSGSAIPAGYGAPYNTLSVSAEQLMNVVCNTSSASVSVGNNSTSQYIYRYGYIWRNNAWQRIDLTGSVPAYEGNWFRGNATATVSLTATELTQENNLIAYICTWNGTAWRCGCRDSACTTPYWQLQRFGNY
ncbi:hypothetical protein A2303_04140 [Candidatus Falkowbacteria bacterium RIFOXYB2_FULL_47_14]|nr:MAG: hypothetical protein A2303_04140 [Candidatus Falkowbacteria bacterium RIFOXYB2_FULL_47_14]